MEAFYGILIPFLGTSLGAACVFFLKKTLSDAVQRALTGFAAGVMVAASVWSLILPAIEQTEAEGRLPPFLPAAAGIVLGALTLFLLDELVRRRTAQLRAEESAREQASRSLEELNQRMERMHKANIVGQLSSMISHELAQPLAAIRYYCEGERELLRSPAERAEALATCNERISSQADRAIAIVEKVRSYARSEATREERVDLARTLSQVLTELRVKGIGKVEVSRLIPSSLPVRGDPLELELLFWNLLKNATEAALRSPQPRIRIEAGCTAGRAEVVIENSGPPMTAEDMERLSSPLSSGSRGGLGLGDAIARSIAESSGGGIEFSSLPAGGLSARVRLPAWEERAADKEAQA